MASDQNHEALQPIHPSMESKLDPDFAKLYNKYVANTPMRRPDLALLRQNYSKIYSYAQEPGPKVGRIYDSMIPVENGAEIPVRVYEPETEGPWPVHVDFHGGGWAVGDLDTEAHICQHVCVKANVVVIDVGYRLVPEHPYPTSIMDSWQSLQYIHAQGAEKFNVKPESISLGGVSAGGLIALALGHLARDAGLKLSLIAVGTPVIDDISKYATTTDSPWPSMRENEFAPTLNWARLCWFDKIKHSAISPDARWFNNLLTAPSFKNLPRTVIYTAGADPMRDEGEAYGRKLLEAGNEVTMKRFHGVPHPFMHMDKELPLAREYIISMAREISSAHWCVAQSW